jgi:hypothetical protein
MLDNQKKLVDKPKKLADKPKKPLNFLFPPPQFQILNFVPKTNRFFNF